MSYGYFPGCSLHSTGVEYDESFRALARRLDIELQEISDWTCCGSSPAHVSSHLLSLALPVRNLLLAEKDGLSEVAVPCAACFARFKRALHEIEADPDLAEDVAYVVGDRLDGTARPVHPLETLSQRTDELAALSDSSLQGLKVACYYGCLLVRPPEVMKFDEHEYPMSMDNVLRAVGIETVDWSSKTDCCGAAMALSETNIVLDLTHEILEEARAVGADAIAVACSLCHVNLDTRQGEVEAAYSTEYQIPVFYFTQLLGLALGLKPEELGLKRHFIDPMPVLAGKE
jgi:heterodisulfide reductase subunit B